MPINLKEHAVFIERLQMDMVPLSIAEKAVQEVLEDNPKLDEAIEMINRAMTDLNNTLSQND